MAYPGSYPDSDLGFEGEPIVYQSDPRFDEERARLEAERQREEEAERKREEEEAARPPPVRSVEPVSISDLPDPESLIGDDIPEEPPAFAVTNEGAYEQRVCWNIPAGPFLVSSGTHYMLECLRGVGARLERHSVVRMGYEQAYSTYYGGRLAVQALALADQSWRQCLSYWWRDRFRGSGMWTVLQGPLASDRLQPSSCRDKQRGLRGLQGLSHPGYDEAYRAWKVGALPVVVEGRLRCTQYWQGE